MRHSTARFARTTAFLCGLGLVVPLLLMMPGRAIAVHSFDPFDHATFPGLDTSGNLGFTGVGTGVYQTPSFDTDLYTYSADATPVADEERDLTGCLISPGVSHFGSKTAWVRFIPTTRGTAKVTVTPNGYNVMVWLYNQVTDARAPGQYRFEEIKDKHVCLNSSHPDTESETLQAKVPAGKVVFIQTASYCALMASACVPTAPPGGPTSVRLEFTPDNADGDAIPDTLDACPTVKGNPPNGCPPVDADHDGATIATDCNDSNPAIHPGAPPIPGNGVDDDCDGKPEAYGVMVAEVTLSFRDTRRGIRVRSLVLRNVSGGGRVEVTCKRGRRRACRKQVRKSSAGGAEARVSSTVRFRRLSGRRLRAGTKLEIRVTKKTNVGRYVRYRIRRAGFKRTDRCMNAGSRKARSRCATSAL